MTKKKAYKRLTVAEKKIRKEIRDDFRERGVLPPVKPKLNRKKFRVEVIEAFESFDKYSDLLHLYEAMTWLTMDNKKISSEQVGVLKMMKLAMEIKKFMKEKSDSGETKYTPLELYEKVVSPILKL